MKTLYIFLFVLASITLVHSLSESSNWPQDLNSIGGVFYAPSIIDLDDDGKLEIAVGTRGIYSYESPLGGDIYIFRSNGSNLSGWPQNNADYDYDLYATTPAIGNLSGNGLKIVSTATQSASGTPKDTSGTNIGIVNAWYSNGTFLWSTTPTAGTGALTPATLADLNDDNLLKIIVPSTDGNLYVFDANGALAWKNTIVGKNRGGGVAVGDLNGDGKLDIVSASQDGKIHAYDNNGVSLWNTSALDATGYESIVIGDVDFDGNLEVITGTSTGIHILNTNGQTIRSITDIAGVRTIGLGDLNRDGNLEIIAGSFTQSVMRAYYSNGSLLWSKTLSNAETAPSSPIVIDINGDELPEILFASITSESNQGKLYTLSHDGSELWAGEEIENSNYWQLMPPAPAVGDMDGDGTLEVVVANIGGKVHLFELPGSTVGYSPWPMYQRDVRNSGLYDLPVMNIASPDNGSKYNESQLIPFTAQGFTVDGNDPTFSWNSSINGTFGNESSFTKSCLTPGDHKITLTASDSEGRSTFLSRIINITNIPPTASITQPSANVYYDDGTVSLSGVGTDPCPISRYEWQSNHSGLISTSSSFVRSDLFLGNHTINFTVWDSNNISATDQITISIVPAPPSTGGSSDSGSNPIPTVEVRYETELLKSVDSDTNFYKAPQSSVPLIMAPLYLLGDLPVSLDQAEEVAGLTNTEIGSLEGDVYTIVSEHVLQKYEKSERVVIARGDLEVDSLASVALAKVLGIPILLVEPGRIPRSTGQAIEGLEVESAFVVGGPVAVSEEVAQNLPQTERIWGQNRVETAVKIAEALMELKSVNTVVITNGQEPDPLAVISAVRYGAPILFVTGDSVPQATEDFLKNHKMRIITVGVSEDVSKELDSLY